jgi:hypothetical protein
MSADHPESPRGRSRTAAGRPDRLGAEPACPGDATVTF